MAVSANVKNVMVQIFYLELYIFYVRAYCHSYHLPSDIQVTARKVIFQKNKEAVAKFQFCHSEHSEESLRHCNKKILQSLCSFRMTGNAFIYRGTGTA